MRACYLVGNRLIDGSTCPIVRDPARGSEKEGLEGRESMCGPGWWRVGRAAGGRVKGTGGQAAERVGRILGTKWDAVRSRDIGGLSTVLCDV